MGRECNAHALKHSKDAAATTMKGKLRKVGIVVVVFFLLMALWYLFPSDMRLFNNSMQENLTEEERIENEDENYAKPQRNEEREQSPVLDLEVGVHVTFEEGMADLLRQLAEERRDEEFDVVLAEAVARAETDGTPVIDAFVEAFEERDPNASLSRYFRGGGVTWRSDNEEVTNYLRTKGSDAIATSPRSPFVYRPNFLVFMAADWSWLHAGVYGDAVVATPNIDRLAAEGVVFEHAFVSSPSSTASRSSFLTGQDFWRLDEAANLYGTLDPGFATYTGLLREAGYHVGFTGRGWGPGETRQGYFNPAGMESSDLDRFLFLRHRGEPFAFWFGTFEAHRAYELHSGAASGIPLDRIAVPAAFPDVTAVRGDIADYYLAVQRIDRELGAALDVLDDYGWLDHTMVVITSDNGMSFPRAKASLYDLGVRVPLIVWMPSEIPGGRRVTDLVSMTDLAPTFLEAAGLETPEAMTGTSLLPQLLATRSGRIDSRRNAVYFGMERHTQSQENTRGGYPMRALRTDDFLYIYNFDSSRWPSGTPNEEYAFQAGAWYSDVDNGPTKSFMVAQAERYPEHFRLAFDRRPREELYDLTEDPDQLVNIASDLYYDDTKQRLRARLMYWLGETGDRRVTSTGGEFYDSQYYPGGIVRRPQH